MTSPQKRPASVPSTPPAKRAPQKPLKLKLLYFDIPGKGEALRLLLNHAKCDFEDVRLTRDQFLRMKESGELAFGQVPALIIDDGQSTHTLVQSAAIARYIGRSSDHKLYPEDMLKAAEVDAVIDQVTDMMCGVLCAKYQERFGYAEVLGGPDGDGTAMVEKALQTSVMPRHFAYFDHLLSLSSTGWIVGTAEPTIADFIVGVHFKQMSTNTVVNGVELLPKHPRLCALVEKLYGLPSVKAWEALRI